MKQVKVLTAALAGTTAMTAYSYGIANAVNRNFREPDLLGKFAVRVKPFNTNRSSPLVGWLLHYLAGLLFAELYLPFWKHSTQKESLKTGLVLGGLTGIAAILIWKFTFAIHPDPPAIQFKKFAGQLFIAHLFFGVVSTVVFKLLQKNTIKNEYLTNDAPQVTQLTGNSI